MCSVMSSSNLQKPGLSCHHVIGGGDSAAEEATYLMNKITVLWNTECQGEGVSLNDLRIKNTLTGHESDLPAKGLFYAIGHEPVIGLVRDQSQPMQMDTFSLSRGQLRRPYGACLPRAMSRISVIGRRLRVRGVAHGGSRS